jgi:hypothetical protein
MSEVIQRIVRSEHRPFVSLLAVLALAALPLSASTLVSNFPYQTDTGDAWETGGSGESGNAVGFTVSSSYSLTQLQVADNFFTASTDGGIYNNLNVGIWQSTTDNLNSATELESWVITPSLPPSQTAELFTLTPGTSTTPAITPVMNDSDFYFITETVIPDPSAGATQATWGWQQNNESPTAQTGYFSEFAGGSWFAETGTTPAFTVSGTPYVPPAPGVPEPRSYALLLAAAFMGILILRRRRNAAA